MKKVLVTGASGFIGRHTLKTLLHQGFEVHAVFQRSNLVDIHPSCNWHLANLLDPPQITKLLDIVQPTHLLHLGWYAVPGKYWTAEENFSWVQASLELLEQFRQRGGYRVVMAGTCAEYNWNYGYCSELITPQQPSSPYGICKNALGELLSSYSDLTGLSSAWGRIFFLYGNHEYPNRLVPSVIRSLLNGEPALCSHGNQIRDFLHVQDVADAFVAVLDSEVNGPINIASGRPVLLKDIIYKIANRIGKPELIKFGAISTSETEPPLLVADTSRLCKEVRWQPQIALETGLEKTISWWHNNILEV
jgi:nucleoside-diphosphate-sugar epimerase